MAVFLRKYNVALSGGTIVRVPLVKRGVVDFAVGADFTASAGDVKVSKDGGAAANIGTLPTAVAMGNTAYWEFTLSAAELSCKQLVVTVADAATKAVEDQSFVVETFGDPSAMYQQDLSAAKYAATMGSTDYSGNTVQTGDNFARIGNTGSGLTSLAPAATALSTAVWTNGRAGFLDNLDAAVSTRLATAGYTAPDNAGIAAINAKTTNLPPDPADASDIAAAFAAVPAAVWSNGSRTLTAFGFSVTVGTNNDKAGYSLANGSIATATFAAGATIPRVTLADTLTTYTGNTPQTGDAFLRLGAPAGASHAADVAAVKADSAAVKVVTDKLATTLVIVGSGPNYQYTVQALANAPAGGGGGGLSTYERAVLRGPVITGADGSVTFLDADDGVTPRVRFGRRDYPGGRIVTLDPT